MFRQQFSCQFRRLCTNGLKEETFSWSPLAEVFNSRPASKYAFLKRKETVGLFGVPELKDAKGFLTLQQECFHTTDDLMREALSDTRTRKMVEVFDELSDSLCKVADLADFIRLAHPVSNYNIAAELTCTSLSKIVEELNTNVRLYKALKDAVTQGDVLPTTEVDRLVGELFLLDFEQNGIHLPEKERTKVVNLNNKILILGQQFVAGTDTPRTIKKSAVPEQVQNLFSTNGEDIVVSGLFVDSSNSMTREMAYRIFLYPDENQNHLLSELLNARFDLAKTCGFNTYAQRVLRGGTIDKSNDVMEFLDILSNGIREYAKSDFQTMNRMKQIENPGTGPLAAWDVPYFTLKAKRDWFNVSQKEYSPYFSLGACMEGLNLLFQKLFGISLIDTPTQVGECWAPDVYKLAVVHETEGILGYIYCDFYERTGKQNQDCHFTIRGGRKLPDGTYQMPIVVLMLNFIMPRWGTPSLLTPHMVDNLFHEMGHAMHSMLARTRYQHVTGTRCSTDFAEVPSVLMEYFASDPRVLRLFAKHFQTKEPIPEDKLQRLCASKKVFTASETQLQIFYAALDQVFHGKHPLPQSTTETLAEIQEKYYGLQYIPNTTWHLRFSHLVGYGAKYYSYLVSKALAYWIWQSYFQYNPLSRTEGERYRSECLGHGGGKNPQKLVADFLRIDPTPDVFASSLVKEISDHHKLMTFYNEKLNFFK